MKSLIKLIAFYQCSTAEQLFEEMSNCLEIEVNASNYQDHLSQFERSYNSWVESYK